MGAFLISTNHVTHRCALRKKTIGASLLLVPAHHRNESAFVSIQIRSACEAYHRSIIYHLWKPQSVDW